MLETVPPQWLWEPSPMALGTIPNGFGNHPQRLWEPSPTALGTIPNGFGDPPQRLWGPSPTALGTLPNGFGGPSQRLWGTFPTALGEHPLKQRRARRQATEDCSTTTEKHKNNYRNTLFQPIIQNKYVTLQILLHIITSP